MKNILTDKLSHDELIHLHKYLNSYEAKTLSEYTFATAMICGITDTIVKVVITFGHTIDSLEGKILKIDRKTMEILT